MFKSIELSNVLLTSTAPKRLQCLLRDLLQVAAKKQKHQSPTLPIASRKPAKKPLSNNSVILQGSLLNATISRVQPEQESILSNIFIHLLGLPTTTSSSQDFNDFSNSNNSNNSLTQLNTQDINFRLLQFKLSKKVNAAQTKT